MLRVLRENMRLSQEAFGQLIGVSGRTVSRWETGRFKPGPLQVKQLARVLGYRGSHAFPGSVWDEYRRLGGRRKMKYPKIEGHACVDCGQPADGFDHRDYLKPDETEPVCRSCNYHRGVALNTFLDHPEYWEKFDWTEAPRTGRWAYAHKLPRNTIPGQAAQEPESLLESSQTGQKGTIK